VVNLGLWLIDVSGRIDRPFLFQLISNKYSSILI
jgi:hypothetical protein